MFKALLSLALLLLPLTAHAKDAALERIVRNREINCGVYVLGSVFSYGKDGKPQGFTVDLFNEIADRTGLKIKYSEISSFGTLDQDLDAGKLDMVCSPLLMMPSTLMKFLPGDALSKDEISIYADGKTDLSNVKGLGDLNDPRYTFVGMDGELGGIFVPKLFPKAKLNMLALGTPPAQILMELHTKKADFVVLSRLAEKSYLKDNPGKLKKVANSTFLEPSVRLFYPSESHLLKANIDAVVEDIRESGILEKLFRKYDLVP